MNMISRFKQNASDTTKALLFAGALVLGGTALVTGWTAAIAPQHDTAVYASTVKANAAGALIGFTLAVAGGFLGGGAFGHDRTRAVRIDPRRKHKNGM